MLSGPIRLLARPGRAGRRVLAALLIAAVPGAPHAAAPALQVLHWWTSASERAAVEVLVAHAAAAGVAWRDAAVDVPLGADEERAVAAHRQPLEVGVGHRQG